MSTASVMTAMEAARCLRPAEVAALLDVSLNTLAIWRHRRLGPSYLKVGRQVRYPRAEVEQFMVHALCACDPDLGHMPVRNFS